jgi:uncharacterized protein (TIGR02611 family)
MKRVVDWTIANIRRLVVGVVGGTVLLIGIIMIVTPGPAVVVIPMGLAILATEFLWARTLLVKVKERIQRMAERKRDVGK